MCCRKMPSFLRNIYATRKKLLIYKQISLEVVFCYKGCFGMKEDKSRLTQYLYESFDQEACFQSHIVNSVECLYNRSHRFSVKFYKSFSESSKLKHKLQKASLIPDLISLEYFSSSIFVYKQWKQNWIVNKATAEANRILVRFIAVRRKTAQNLIRRRVGFRIVVNQLLTL